jgi:hypothetical protein
MLLKGKSNYYPETTVIHYKGESTVKDGIYMKRFQESMQFFYKKSTSSVIRFYENRDLVFSFVKMFQGRQRKKTPESYILYSSTDELISKMESKLQNKVFFMI